MPSSPNRKVITVKGQRLPQNVDDLIDPFTGQWDEALIRDNFIWVDVERILKIPLSPNMTEDFVAWQYTKSFSFSVRSAYYVEWEHQFGAQTRWGDGQGAIHANPVWDILWKLQIPSKVKIFAWRALHGIVPGMSILANRHIKVQPQCPVCKQGRKICGI